MGMLFRKLSMWLHKLCEDARSFDNRLLRIVA
nr:MAG TPA: hypothetical protein [Caudoviricetes sp.]